MSQQGYIFLCNNVTEAECFKRSLFGAKLKYRSRVKELEIGDKLFLYNQSTKLLHGIFEATSGLQESIVSDAWNGDFPLQVKVRRISNYQPLSREDIQSNQYLYKVIKFDHAGRPSPRVNTETLNVLEQLFQAEERIKTYDNEYRYTTDDGHKVRSEGELAIDNWLYKNRIPHGYEIPIPHSSKLCDFQIPRDPGSVYVEYWGLTDPKYLRDKEQKIELYRKQNLRLINLEHKDLKDLDAILRKELINNDQTSFL